jgi:nucleoside-diphosphate kinase
MIDKENHRRFYMQRTLVLIKPDAIQRGLKQTMIDTLLSQGVQIARQRDIIVTKEQILAHYADVIERLDQVPFADYVTREFVGQSITVLEVTSDSLNLIRDIRTFLGATDPVKAEPGTIRAMYGNDSFAQAQQEQRITRNLLHASDSEDAATQELALWFDEKHVT